MPFEPDLMALLIVFDTMLVMKTLEEEKGGKENDLIIIEREVLPNTDNPLSHSDQSDSRISGSSII